MMRKATLLVLAAALLLFSGEGFYRAVRGRVATHVTCEDIVRGGLPAPRVRVSGCNIFYGGIGYRGRDGTIDELYLPVQPLEAHGLPARIVISSRDAEALAIAGRALGGGPVTTREQSLDAMQKVVAHLGLATEFTALARTGLIDRLRSRRILSGLPVAVADDAVILDLNGAPDFLRPVIALIAGGLLALLAFWPLHRPSTTAVAPETAVLPATHETTFVEASETFAPQALAHAARRRSTQVSLPQLLLLALAVDKGPEAIETAPPLGSRLEVAEILAGVIQDLTPAEMQNVLARPDGSVQIDLGTRDPVATAVVVARGEAGVALVKEVLLMTGWRAFAPKTGLFVSVDDLDAVAALAAEDPL
jgi:hypothetical protein